MKKILRILALVVALVGGGYWYAAGHNTGWNKNRVPVEKKDPVTDQTYTDYEDRFVPGMDFLGGVLIGAVGLFAGSWLMRKK